MKELPMFTQIVESRHEQGVTMIEGRVMMDGSKWLVSTRKAITMYSQKEGLALIYLNGTCSHV